MFYYNYSLTQLESFADDLNRKYDATRLTTPKQVDVYDIVDLLGARLAFEYLSPDRSYLGATLFHPGTLWVWPGNPYVQGMMPARKYFHSGSGPAAKYLDMGDYVTYCFDVYGKIIKITDLCVPDNNDHTFRFGKCVNVASTFAEIEPYIDKESVVKHVFADTEDTSIFSSSCNAPAE